MKTRLVALLVVALLAGGCDLNPASGRRLRLPAGNAEAGRAAFIELKCTQCHRVAGVNLPAPASDAPVVVDLGGSVERLRTVGDLMTAIIHPKLAISVKLPGGTKTADGRSPMPVMNDRMTVAQLIDLVTFLQPRYQLIPPPSEGGYYY